MKYISFNKKTYYLYEGYKKEWQSKYWRYSFQMKVHKLLIELLAEEFFDDDNYSNDRFKKMVKAKIEKKLNTSEKEYYNKAMGNTNGQFGIFLSWYHYKELWMTNKYEQDKIDGLLLEDLRKRELYVISKF